MNATSFEKTKLYSKMGGFDNQNVKIKKQQQQHRRSKRVGCEDSNDALWLMVEDLNLTKKQLEFITKSFRQIDENGNGLISVEELERASRLLGYNPTRKDVKQMISKVDHDGDGSIDFREFAEMMRDQFGAQEYEQHHIRESFKMLDKDGNGFIDHEELRQYMTSQGEHPLTDEEFQKVVKDLDADNDGKIDINELAKILTTPVDCDD